MPSTYEQIIQNFNFGLSWIFGSFYSRALHDAVEEKNLPMVKSSVEESGMYVDLIAYSHMGFKPHVWLKVAPLHYA